MYRTKVLEKRMGGAVRTLAVLFAFVLLLSACAAPPPVAPPAADRSLEAPTATAQATATPAPTATPTAEPAPEKAPGDDGSSSGGDTMRGGGAPTELIERAKAEVASLARSSADSVQVKNVERVEWPDASLGCPKGGMMYAQVLTPGYKIVLESGGRTYEFHSGMDPAGPLVRCDGR